MDYCVGVVVEGFNVGNVGLGDEGCGCCIERMLSSIGFSNLAYGIVTAKQDGQSSHVLGFFFRQ
jgi:hypothetical protein